MSCLRIHQNRSSDIGLINFQNDNIYIFNIIILYISLFVSCMTGALDVEAKTLNALLFINKGDNLSVNKCIYLCVGRFI